MKKKLWLDIKYSITKSKGRFISIFSLMLLGTFVFVGLQVTGPNMRDTSEEFFSRYNLADMTVMSDWGIDEKDIDLLKKTKNLKEIEFGYIKDVLIKETDKSLRIFSNSKNISKYKIVKGKLPSTQNDIVLDYLQKNKYDIGDYVEINEGKDKKVLLEKKFRVVGFAKSSEIVQKTNIGYTNIGTGELDGFGIVNKNAFNSSNYMIARMIFNDTDKLNIYSDKYEDIIKTRKNELENILGKRSEYRLKNFKNKKSYELKDGIQKIEDSKRELETALANSSRDFKNEIEYKRSKLDIEQENIELSQNSLEKMKAPKYIVNDRSDNPGYQQHLENSERIDILSRVFPVFLFGIAALVSLTTMTRFVEEERINMGTLKSLGYTDFDIKKKFIVYGFVSGILGGIVGTILGHTILPILIFQAYSATTIFVELELKFYPIVTIMSLLIVMIFTVISGYIASTKDLKDNVSKLLLPKTPKEGSRIFLEKIDFIWDKLSFNHKVTARNIFRYKKRMFMTILGVAGCTGLLIMGFGIKHSLQGIVDRQFGDIMKYDLLVSKNRSSKELEDLLSNKKVKRKESILYETMTINNGEIDANIMVTSNVREFKKYINLVDRKTQESLDLKDSGIVITEKMSKLLNIKIGDNLTLSENGKARKIKVSGITELYMGHYAFLNDKTYNETFSEEFKTNGYLITLNNKSDENIRKVSSEFIKTNGVESVIQSKSVSKKIDDVMGGLDKVILVLISCASLLAVIVIYNLTNINISERVRELSTIKVLGFYDNEVTMYIYRETIILSALGILSGYVFGKFLHDFIVNNLPPNEVMFDPVLRLSNFLTSGLITMGITLSLMVIMHRRIKSINMLEALKSID